MAASICRSDRSLALSTRSLPRCLFLTAGLILFTIVGAIAACRRRFGPSQRLHGRGRPRAADHRDARHLSRLPGHYARDAADGGRPGAGLARRARQQQERHSWRARPARRPRDRLACVRADRLQAQSARGRRRRARGLRIRRQCRRGAHHRLCDRRHPGRRRGPCLHRGPRIGRSARWRALYA